MQRIAVLTLPDLAIATRALSDLALSAQRAATSVEAFSHGVSMSFNIDVPCAAWRRLHSPSARVEILRFQAKRKGRSGWKGIPRRLKMPGHVKFAVDYTPAGES